MHKITIINNSKETDQKILSCVSKIIDTWDLNKKPDFETRFHGVNVVIYLSSNSNGSLFTAADYK